MKKTIEDETKIISRAIQPLFLILLSELLKFKIILNLINTPPGFRGC